MENLTYKYLGWLKEDNNYRDVFVRMKIRLLRNVADFPFPNQLGNVKRKTLLNRVEWIVKNNGFLNNFEFINFDKIPPSYRQIFWEKGITDLESKEEGKGVLITKRGDISILINEDSHFKAQKIISGFELEKTFSEVFNVEDKISEYFEFAFDHEMGYLASSLNNLGLGIRVTFWVHLVGLQQMGGLSKLFRSLRSSKFIIKGVYEEENYPVGNLYEISLNEGFSSEDQIYSKIKKFAEKVVEKEREARETLKREKGIFIEDLAGKSLGLLKYSKILGFRGALELLFNLRLASSLNIFSIPLKFLDTISVLIQPVHIKMRFKKEISSQERDILRANLLREVFKSYKID